MKKNVTNLLNIKGPLAENEVKDLMKSFGINTTKFEVVKTKKDIETINLNFPVAFKICSRKILHKTDVNGVVLNIQNKEELLRVFEDFNKRFPGEAFIIDQMQPKGVEVIIGLTQDSTFGLSIMCGVGGIYTELYKDVSFRVVPINNFDANEMLDEIKGKRLLEGFRNIKANKDLVIELLLKVSKLGEKLIDKVDQMDLNPVFIYENEYCVVDAKMILK
jgi:hypothetical protein